MDNERTASAGTPGCHCPARSTWSFLLMVVITPTASYSGSNVLQSRARPANAGPGPTPPAFTGVTEPPKRRLGHQGDAPSCVLFGQPAAARVSVFGDGEES